MLNINFAVKSNEHITQRFKIDAELWRRSEVRALYKSANLVRSFVRKQWRAATFKRNSSKLHRKAIINSVTSVVKRSGDRLQATIGLRRRDKYVSVANILDPGFTHRSGKVIPGKHIRAAGLTFAGTTAAGYEHELRAELEKLLIKAGWSK